jgi:hypothetical protein
MALIVYQEWQYQAAMANLKAFGWKNLSEHDQAIINHYYP